MDIKIVGVIPSRFASSRFPGKPLAMIHGKPMIQHVYERAASCGILSKVVVATDHDEIFNCVKSFGGEVMMTASTHQSGTDRCAEIMQKLAGNGEEFDVLVNIQGDEPFIDPIQITKLAECFLEPKTDIATLVKQINDIDELLSPNTVKAVLNKNSKALYFSRQPLPYCRSEEDPSKWLEKGTYYKHIGIYAYRTNVLEEITQLPLSVLEKSESLEQLRWLDNGYEIYVSQTDIEGLSVDTPEDLEKLLGNS